MDILILEDDPVQVALIEKCIQSLGTHRVRVAGTLGQAFDILTGSEYEPDVIITDLCLPDGNGEVLITHLGVRRFMSKIIVVSGAEEDRKAGLYSYGYPILSKPLNCNQLAYILKLYEK